jgi:hypothetical protein
MHVNGSAETGNEILLDLSPLGADPRELPRENGLRRWNAESFESKMLAVPRNGAALERGWYRATARIDCLSGDVRQPELFLPNAAGKLVRRVSMERDGSTFHADFFLPRGAAQLRFDPTWFPSEFACDGLSVTPLRRPRALPVRIARRARLYVARAGRLASYVRWRVSQVRHVLTTAPLFERRRARVLAAIDRNGVGIEIGPSHSPLAPKRDGFNVQIIDHFNRAQLRQKYTPHGLDIDLIEEVDFVWHGQSYLELTGKPRHYDWIIASHLIEHTPDLIAFLNDCDSILNDTGVLSLVIPDKRYTFDRFRPITGLARVIDSHLAGNRIHSAGASAEYFMNVAARDQQLSWSAGRGHHYHFIHSASYARERIEEVLGKGSYLDIHNWVFVPHSFRLLVNDLYALGYTKLREVAFHPTEDSEFYVTLGRHGEGPRMSRLEILKAIDAEVAAVD